MRNQDIITKKYELAIKRAKAQLNLLQELVDGHVDCTDKVTYGEIGDINRLSSILENGIKFMAPMMQDYTVAEIAAWLEHRGIKPSEATEADVVLFSSFTRDEAYILYQLSYHRGDK